MTSVVVERCHINSALEVHSQGGVVAEVEGDVVQQLFRLGPNSRPIHRRGEDEWDILEQHAMCTSRPEFSIEGVRVRGVNKRDVDTRMGHVGDVEASSVAKSSNR